MSKQIDLSGRARYVVRAEEPIQKYKADALGWTWEVRDGMWLEGLFEEDPGTRGLASMRHTVLATSGEGQQAAFTDVTLQGDSLWWDYLPASFRATPDVFSEALSSVYRELAQERGLWKDNHSASKWCFEGPRSHSRGLPYTVGYLSENDTLEKIYLLPRFYQRCYVPDQNGKPASAHLRWYTKVLDLDLECCYGEIVSLHDEASKEFRLLDHSTRLPEPLAKRIFALGVKQHQEFVGTL